MTQTKKTTDSISPIFFLQVMNHWGTPGIVGSMLGMSVFLLCSGPWGIALGVTVSFSGLIYSAARFFGGTPVKSNNSLQYFPHSERRATIFSPRSVSSPSSILEVDSLESYLFLLYQVEPPQLLCKQTNIRIDSKSPLITGIHRIQESHRWGTELHAHYLSRLFNVPYCVVRVSGRVRVDASGHVAHFNPGKKDYNQLQGLNYIQLINHGGMHWTTMLGTEPLVGEVEQRIYLNNPGGGDCLFYAFSLGLAKYMCHDVSSAKEMKQSALFKQWRKLDPVMKERGRATAFFNLGKAASPREDVTLHAAWGRCQQSLRCLVARYMHEQLIEESAIALDIYQKIHAKQPGLCSKNFYIAELYDKSPLYREYNLLYNLDKKAVVEDLTTNIFQELHPIYPSMSYNM